jgi:hypothetical protein
VAVAPVERLIARLVTIPGIGPHRAGDRGRDRRGHDWVRYPTRGPVPLPGPPVRRGNEKKAAAARTLMCIAWAVIRHDSDHTEVGTDYYDFRAARNREHLVRHH